MQNMDILRPEGEDSKLFAVGPPQKRFAHIRHSLDHLSKKIPFFVDFFQAVCLVGAHTFRSGPRPGHTPWGHTCVGKVVRPRSDT